MSKEKFICQYCGRECKKPGSLSVHQKHCKYNPNRVQKIKSPLAHRKKGSVGWNKGLSKETDERIKKAHETFKRNQKLGLHKTSSHPHTEETKRKLSKYAKERKLGGYHKGSGRSKHGWYKSFYCDSTYELVYLIYCLDHNINIKRCNKSYEYFYNGKYHKYYPDFIINNDTIIEIKGYYTDLVDIKANSITNMKYKILYKEDLQEEFEYIYKTYNVNDKTIQTLYENTII